LLSQYLNSVFCTSIIDYQLFTALTTVPALSITTPQCDQ